LSASRAAQCGPGRAATTQDVTALRRPRPHRRGRPAGARVRGLLEAKSGCLALSDEGRRQASRHPPPAPSLGAVATDVLASPGIASTTRPCGWSMR
jgi:hypothetical protein